MFYFYTNELHFSPEFLGRVRLAGSIASLAGIRGIRWSYAHASHARRAPISICLVLRAGPLNCFHGCAGPSRVLGLSVSGLPVSHHQQPQTHGRVRHGPRGHLSPACQCSRGNGGANLCGATVSAASPGLVLFPAPTGRYLALYTSCVAMLYAVASPQRVVCLQVLPCITVCSRVCP